MQNAYWDTAFYFKGTYLTLQNLCDASISKLRSNIESSVVICEWGFSLKYMRKYCAMFYLNCVKCQDQELCSVHNLLSCQWFCDTAHIDEISLFIFQDNCAWAATSENVSSDMSAQRRLKSPCVFVQSMNGQECKVSFCEHVGWFDTLMVFLKDFFFFFF